MVDAKANGWKNSSFTMIFTRVTDPGERD